MYHIKIVLRKTMLLVVGRRQISKERGQILKNDSQIYDEVLGARFFCLGGVWKIYLSFLGLILLRLARE